MNITPISNNKQNPNFESLRTLNLRRSISSDDLFKISNRLNMKEEDILELTKNKAKKRIQFLKSLAKRFNIDFFDDRLKTGDKSVITQIFNIIKKPTGSHFYFVENYRGDFNELEALFLDTLNDKARLRFARKVYSEIIKNNSNSYDGIVTDLLASENSDEYMKNYKKYKSYLILHNSDKDAVSELDAMLEEDNFDGKIYDNILRRKEITRKIARNKTPNTAEQVIIANYTPEREKILKTLRQKFFNMDEDVLNTPAAKEVVDFLMSTNKKNYKSRKMIIKYANHFYGKYNNERFEETFIELKKLIDTYENDRFARSFIKKMKKQDSSIEDPITLNKIFEKVPPKKIYIFSKNAFRIFHKYYGSILIDAVEKNIENPNYERHNYNRFGIRNILRNIENYTNKFIYTLLSIGDSKPVTQEIIKEEAASIESSIKQEILQEIDSTVEPKIKQEISSEAEHEISIETKQEAETITENKPLAEENTIETSSEQIVKENEEAIIETPKPSKISQRELNKQKVAKDIIEIIKTKLGVKTLEKQQDTFSKNATKMRLSMLPEIFASIADTRKADRAVGKHRINSSNSDAMELFLLINGTNKKFINYLLKKRNADNTRMFEVKEIIAIVKRAEAKIQAEKKANPQYRANDARKYYNHLYEAKIQQYGKVKPQRKTKISVSA